MKFFILILTILPLFLVAQKTAVSTKAENIKSAAVSKINPEVAELIPFKNNGKTGYKNQNGKIIIPAQFSNAGFFTADCNLLNSANTKMRKFGSGHYASVRQNNIDYRIDKLGKKVYTFRDSDLAKCPAEYKVQMYSAFIFNGKYGIMERGKDPTDYRNFVIYPDYDYLHIMEGDDITQPMIIAAKNGKFGVISIKNKAIIPFRYEDIKPNYSWKLARLFEVSADGFNYYFVDANGFVY